MLLCVEDLALVSLGTDPPPPVAGPLPSLRLGWLLPYSLSPERLPAD